MTARALAGRALVVALVLAAVALVLAALAPIASAAPKPHPCDRASSTALAHGLAKKCTTTPPPDPDPDPPITYTTTRILFVDSNTVIRVSTDRCGGDDRITDVALRSGDGGPAPDGVRILGWEPVTDVAGTPPALASVQIDGTALPAPGAFVQVIATCQDA